MSTDRSGGAGDTALARCVACPTAEFAERHWSRTALLSRAAELPRRFDDLIDAAAVDELVSSRGLRTPFLRMAQDGNVLPAARFTRGGGAGAGIADQAADDKILGAMADGATLVLQALHRSWPPLVRFGSQLAEELGHPVQINGYITPPQNQGFAPHHDVHDVFVLQIAGRKQWTIHEPVVSNPAENQPSDGFRDLVTTRVAEPPLIDTVLEPGDALYLPRGSIHAAQALGELSIHLTVGVHPVTRRHLARHVLDTALDDPQLRASLPMGLDLSDPAVLAGELEATLALVRERMSTVDPAAIARLVGQDLMKQTRPAPLSPLAQLAAADALDPRDGVRLRAGLRMRVDDRGEELELQLGDRSVRIPSTARDALKALLARTVVPAGELCGAEVDEGMALAGRLMRAGVLVPADAH